MDKKELFTQNTSIKRFIYAIENKLFVEAHELLEEDWKKYKKKGEINKAKALKGLINGATALALYFIKNRPEGYKKVWPVFEKYVHLLEEVDLDEKEKYLEARDILIKINNSISFK